MLRIQSFNELKYKVKGNDFINIVSKKMKLPQMMMHMRWDIENSIFNKLKTYSALEHCFVHHSNAIEDILYLMSIATNLTQLFIFRRLSGTEIKLLTQKEIVRLLEKDLYLAKSNRKYIFDTT